MFLLHQHLSRDFLEHLRNVSARLGTDFEVCHAHLPGVILSFFYGHLALSRKVKLVSHQEKGAVYEVFVSLQVHGPSLGSFKAFQVCDVVHYESCLSSSVVHFYYALVPLLTSRVPDL